MLLNGDSAYDNSVILLKPESPSRASETLSVEVSRLLTESSVPNQTLVWGVDECDFKGKRFISLVEFDVPLVEDLEEKDFAILKRLVTEASSIQWVTSLEEPLCSPILGLARVVRSEIPSLQFRTLHLARGTTNIAQAAELVHKVEVSKTTDNECREINGLLHISRAEIDHELNERLARISVDEDIEQIPLERVSGPQKLYIQSPGILDSVCFEADHLPSEDLQDDDVEIRVASSALK
jgi:hypothetical protein